MREDGSQYHERVLVGPNDDFYFPQKEKGLSAWTRSLQIVDVSDLASPRLVSRWWVPGQHVDEVEARAKWRSAGDEFAFDNFHGPEYVPKRIEQGGRYGYGGWGTFGLLVHDLSDPEQPKLVGQWDSPEYIPGPMMAHHTVDVTRIDRGFVISSPESIASECGETWHDTWLVDVRDPTRRHRIARSAV